MAVTTPPLAIRPLPPRHGAPHLFSVDVEDYFQVVALEPLVPRESWDGRPTRVEANTDRLLGLLAERGVQGTFFTLGWVARKFPALVARIAAEGHEVASHGDWHRRVSQLTPEGFREELRASKAAVEAASGQPCLGYRAPSFSIRPGLEWAFDVLLEEGYRYDSSLFPIRRPDYGYPGVPSGPFLVERSGGTLLEVPLATTNVFGLRLPAAGGGYLRQFPLGVLRRAFREAGARGEPAAFYIHPWEYDPGQPRLPCGRLTAFRHYRNLHLTWPRMDRLLREFRFGSIAGTHGDILAQCGQAAAAGRGAS
jgi:polysaccharide deacetylase family protein (PEP-CTERM system associated)